MSSEGPLRGRQNDSGHQGGYHGGQRHDGSRLDRVEYSRIGSRRTHTGPVPFSGSPAEVPGSGDGGCRHHRAHGWAGLIRGNHAAVAAVAGANGKDGTGSRRPADLVLWIPRVDDVGWSTDTVWTPRTAFGRDEEEVAGSGSGAFAP